MKSKLTSHLFVINRIPIQDDRGMGNRTIDRIFDILKNGKPSTLEEITEKTSIQEQKLSLIITFLQKFQFIDVDKGGKIRLNSLTRQFLEETDKNDPTPSYEEITA